MKKEILLTVAALAAAALPAGGMWTDLTDETHVAGPKIGEDDLLGKVVFVDTTFVPRVQEAWNSFRGKPFQVVGSVRESGKIPGGLAYPVYKRFGLVKGDPGTDMFVVNHRGRVVYAGASDRDATEAIVNAIMQVGLPLSLTGDVALKNYKALEKKLQIGKNIKSDLKALEAAVKKSEAKTATKVDKEKGAEARAILRAVEEGRKDVQREIKMQARTDPAKAIKTIRDFMVTFPEEGKVYEDKLPLLAELAKKTAAEKKAQAAKGKR